MTYRPERGYRTGRLRHFINIQDATVDETTGEPIPTWNTKFPRIPARHEQTTGNERFQQAQLEAEISSVFTIRTLPGITPEMRISYGGRLYGITHVKPVQGEWRYTELYCRTVDDNQEGNE